MHRGRKPAAIETKSGEQETGHHAGDTTDGWDRNLAASARA
jgi:hypothetical protein